ncbi:MAG: hypothetical protein EXS16_09170 [Gemmataceae bacterium]|nr:hypothetical protein [Gemmataceae bacterium]
MPDFLRPLIDAAVAIALAFALLCVFLVDRFVLSRDPGLGENTMRANVIKTKFRDPKKLRLAVTPSASFPPDPFTKKPGSKWDDMGKLLTEMGDGYKFDVLPIQAIALDPKKLNDYDVVFLTCAAGGLELKDALVDYVSGGGILYASDWRYGAVAAAFPAMVAPKYVAVGAQQELNADIVDPDLRDVLGSNKIHLKFDIGEWKSAAFAGPRVKPLIQGRFKKFKAESETIDAPLMVRFSMGKGTVIFTSFHNEKQNSAVETKLLKYIVFSLVTAGVDADVNDKLEEGGFAPQKSNLLSTPKRGNTIEKKYTNKSQCDLRFVLGFRNEGAKLRFRIVSPDAKQFTVDLESTAVVEVPGAIPGEWTYSVTDQNLPYDNFPFTVTVGEKR